MDKRIKCTACHRVKFEEDFLKNKKILKTCIGCREKRKTDTVKDDKEKQVPANIPAEVPAKVPANIPAEVPANIPAEVPANIPAEVPTNIPAEVPEEVPIKVPVNIPVEVPAEKKDKDKDHVKDKRWIGMSGHWIQRGDEQKLHKTLTRKMNRQFHQRSAFPVHKYLMRWVMVDIRDRYTG